MATAGPATEKKPKLAVAVLYNGRIEAFGYHPEQRVHALLSQALEKFAIVQNANLMSLFDAAGNELSGDASLAEAGVKPGDELVLRQSSVKGG